MTKARKWWLIKWGVSQDFSTISDKPLADDVKHLANEVVPVVEASAYEKAVSALRLMASSTQFKEGEYGYQFELLAKDTLKELGELE